MNRIVAVALIVSCWLTNMACNPRMESLPSGGRIVIQDTNSKSIFIGRFAYAYPKSLQLAGRTQSIYRVDVRAVRIEGRDGESLWLKHLAEIRETPPPHDVLDRIIRIYNLDAGTRAVMFYDSTDVPRPRRLDAMRIFGATAVIASRFGAQGQDADMETLVKHVLNGYTPDTDFGFGVELGAVASEPGKNEATMARFVDPAMPGFEVVFNTQTVREPLTIDELSDVEEIRRGTEDAEMQVLKSVRRPVAGFDGLEERIVVKPRGEAPLVRFSWKYGGQPLRGDAPQILIRAVCHQDQHESVAEKWELILSSFRRVSVQKGTR